MISNRVEFAGGIVFGALSLLEGIHRALKYSKHELLTCEEVEDIQALVRYSSSIISTAAEILEDERVHLHREEFMKRKAKNNEESR